MTLNEQLEVVVAEIAAMPEPTCWADLWVGPVNLADLKAESDPIIARGRIETYRRDAVALRERAMRASGYVSCLHCHEAHSAEITCNFAGILRDASEQ